jgi:hypothetical protein
VYLFIIQQLVLEVPLNQYRDFVMRLNLKENDFFQFSKCVFVCAKALFGLTTIIETLLQRNEYLHQGKYFRK